MKKSEKVSMFPTGICENTFSKRTLISVITGLKNLETKDIYIITPSQKSVVQVTFSEAVNYRGCIVLKGFEKKGISLYEVVQDYKPETLNSDSTRELLEVVREIISAALLLHDKMGIYPHLILNGVFIDKNERTITFLPGQITDFLNKYQNIDIQKTLYYCYSVKDKSFHSGEFEFTRAVAKFLYLCFSKDHDIINEPIFDAGNFMPDISRQFSNALWDLMHNKPIELRSLQSIITESLKSGKDSAVTKVPLLRSRTFISFKSALLSFFARRKKLVVVSIILAAIATYLVFDFLQKSRKIDYTAGLNPQQVIELYYQAVDNLDLELLDSIFYKRAGKQIKDELSTLYIMTKLEQVYNRQLIDPEDTLHKTDVPRIYGIKDLHIQQISDDENPVFIARYSKYVRTENEDNEYAVKETLYLKNYNDRWYIVRSEKNTYFD
jgi:hypothetical protein